MKRSRLAKSRSKHLSPGCERLEVRQVLDASAMPIWDQMPDMAGQSLTVDAGITATAAAQFGDLTYTTANGEVTINGYTGAGGAVIIPALIDGLPVRAIRNDAFQSNLDILSVTVPSSVRTIGDRAFQSCCNLSSIIIPSSVTSIGSYAFQDCVKLASVAVPGTVTHLGDRTFYNCSSLSSVHLPQSLLSIGAAAFANCGLTALALPAGLSSIGAYAFANNRNLSSVSIPATVWTIGDAPFQSCMSMQSITVEGYGSTYTTVDGILYYNYFNTKKLVQCPGGKQGIVTIPSGITDIGTGAFQSCANLTGVVVPSSVKTVGSYAFQSCNSLTTITIPSSVTSIGDFAFRSCTSLQSINVEPSNANYKSLRGMLFSNYSVSPGLIQCPGGITGTVTIPSGVSGIGNSAFHSCIHLTGVVIPSSVTGIGSSAFESCNSLTTITIPKTVSTIGDHAFRSCMSLQTITVEAANSTFTSSDGLLIKKSFLSPTLIQCPSGRTGEVVIPHSVTSIDSSAFKDCRQVTGITIPAAVKNIVGYPFGSCIRLSAFSVDPANTFYASVDGVLYNKSLTALHRYPVGKAGSCLIPPSVTRISSLAFYGCVTLSDVRIPSSVQSIGEYAFSECTGLTSICMEGYPPSLESFALYNASGTVFRLPTATGWSSTYGGRPVEILQPIDVSAGQTITASISAETSRVLKQGAGTAILSTASTRTGGTVVEAGEIVIRHSEALGTGLLEVQAGAKATLQVGYDRVAVKSLSLADASRLELGTGKLAVAANGFTESDIRTKLIAGRNGGSWDGTNGITSTFAGGDRSIGYRVADGALEVAYAAPGDSNLDGVIDILDLSEILSAGKFNAGGTANWTQGDTNYDGVFDILDLSEILGTGLFNQANYLTQASANSVATDAGTVATFDSAFVFAALAAESSSQPTMKRKSL